jgi:hypothetical protein
MPVTRNQMMPSRRDVNPAGFEFLAIVSMACLQGSGPGQDLRQPGLLPHVNRHEHRRRQIGRQITDDLDQWLDAAGRPPECQHDLIGVRVGFVAGHLSY